MQQDQIALSTCQKSSSDTFAMGFCSVISPLLPASAWWRKLADGAMVNAGITVVIMPFKKKISGEHITDENYLEDVAICLNH